MKLTRVMAAVAIVVTGVFFAGNTLAGRLSNRQIRHQKRIHQGFASGQLIWRETCALEREQFRIQRRKRRALKEGLLSPGERLRLQRQQDRASRHIFRLKHKASSGSQRNNEDRRSRNG